LFARPQKNIADTKVSAIFFEVRTQTAGQGAVVIWGVAAAVGAAVIVGATMSVGFGLVAADGIAVGTVVTAGTGVPTGVMVMSGVGVGVAVFLPRHPVKHTINTSAIANEINKKFFLMIHLVCILVNIFFTYYW